MDWEKFWRLAIAEMHLQIEPPPPLAKVLAALQFENPVVLNGCFRWKPTCLITEGGSELSEDMMRGQVPLAELLTQAPKHVPFGLPGDGSPLDGEDAWGKLLADCGFNLFIDDNWVFPPPPNENERYIPYGYYVVDLKMGQELKGLHNEEAFKAIRAKNATPMRAIEGVQLLAMSLDIFYEESLRLPKRPHRKSDLCFLGSSCPNWHGSGDEFLHSFVYKELRSRSSLYLRKTREFWGGTDTGFPTEGDQVAYPYFTAWAKL